MGVTFAPEYSETDIVTYELRCEDTLLETALTYRDAKLNADAHGLICEKPDSMCLGYGAKIVTITDVPEVHVSNANAYYLLGQLGLIDSEITCPKPLSLRLDETSGSCDAADFLGRVLVAQGLGGHDVGRPLQDLSKEAGPRVYDCGRQDGYGDMRLEQLAEIARWAQCADRKVQWC